MNKTIIIGVIFVLAILGILIYSSMGIGKYRCEVCVNFQGRNACRVASADTQDHAIRSAQSNACALIASGVTDTMHCESSVPQSVTFLNSK